MIQLSVWQPLEICKLKFLISDLRLGDQARYFNCVSQFHWLHSWFLHNFRTFRIENDLLYSNIQNIRNPQDNQNFRLNFRGYAIALYFPIIIYDKKKIYIHTGRTQLKKLLIQTKIWYYRLSYIHLHQHKNRHIWVI